MDPDILTDAVRLAGVDPVDTFFTALGRVGSETSGPDHAGQYTSNCPGPLHDRGDRRPSLRWFKTANSVVKFHCHVGCEYVDVMKALGLSRYQLRPVRYEFDYYDRDGTYRFTVRRTESADDTKKFTQYRRAPIDGGEDQAGNGLDDGEALFWLEPALAEAAEDARSSGTALRLWLPEGEKDAIAIGGAGIEEWDFVTTAPQGAGGWKPAHLARIGELYDAGVLAEVILVTDDDPAGMNRGFRIRDELAAALPDLAVRVITPTGGADVADLCDQYGTSWVEHCRELSESEIVEALEEGTAVSGFMARYPMGVGARAGRRGMSIRSDRDKDGPTPVIPAEFEPIEVWDEGWVVRVTGPRRDPVETILTRSDLASKAAFDRWLVSRARTGMVPRCGVGGGEVAQSLGMWLDWACDVRGVRRVVVTPHLTWVRPDNGEPARSPEPPPVWVSPDAEGGLVRWTGQDRAGSAWGTEGTEVEAAWAWARALTFGDEESVAAVAGWAGAMLLTPWLSQWMPTKPGLALIAPSGSGKTHGAARLILQLVGCDGSSTSSVAALRRRLAQGGVSAIQWIDDSEILDDHHLKEVLRVATSQSEHTLANPDAGVTATATAKLVGCVVVSAEGVAWAEETAMADRFLFVRPVNPQGRRSLRVGSDELQWADVQALTSEYSGELTRVAGWSVLGLAGPEVLGRLEAWVRSIGSPVGRGDVGPFVAALGARAVATWLTGVRAAAGPSWPGKGPEWSHARYNRWDWLVAAADKSLEAARDAGPRFNTLVNTVIPAAMTAAAGSVSAKGATGGVVTGAMAGSEEEFRAWFRTATTAGGGAITTALPTVVVDRDERVWVWVKGLSTWYEKVGSGRRGAETRIAGVRALSDQMETVEDNPEWATWSEHKSGGRAYVRPGIRISKTGGGVRAVYRRLTAEASAAVLRGE